MKKLAEKLEAVAQNLYDIRDSVPSDHNELWDRLDAAARRLSKLAGKVRVGRNDEMP
jgi:hypothetical protein